MNYGTVAVAAFAGLAMLAFVGAPQAEADQRRTARGKPGHVHSAGSRSDRKRRARVRGYLARRGG
jgi:hypothetical protein